VVDQHDLAGQVEAHDLRHESGSGRGISRRFAWGFRSAGMSRVPDWRWRIESAGIAWAFTGRVP
jgi:hypothetical protein